MSTGFKRSVRTALAGSLVFGGALFAAVIGGAPPASAATVVQTIAVGNDPEGVSSDGTHVWEVNDGDGTVSELNASTGSVVRTIAVGSAPLGALGVSSDGTHVWVANTLDNTVTEIVIQPTITSFSPASGPVGTVVTIKGTNLSGATKVTFNGVKGTITKDTATKIKVKVPSGATTGKIKVVTPGGRAKTATAFTVT
jgi:YVTN family beta-propeller protein